MQTDKVVPPTLHREICSFAIQRADTKPDLRRLSTRVEHPDVGLTFNTKANPAVAHLSGICD